MRRVEARLRLGAVSGGPTGDGARARAILGAEAFDKAVVLETRRMRREEVASQGGWVPAARAAWRPESAESDGQGAAAAGAQGREGRPLGLDLGGLQVAPAAPLEPLPAPAAPAPGAAGAGASAGAETTEAAAAPAGDARRGGGQAARLLAEVGLGGGGGRGASSAATAGDDASPAAAAATAGRAGGARGGRGPRKMEAALTPGPPDAAERARQLRAAYGGGHACAATAREPARHRPRSAHRAGGAVESRPARAPASARAHARALLERETLGARAHAGEGGLRADGVWVGWRARGGAAEAERARLAAALEAAEARAARMEEGAAVFRAQVGKAVQQARESEAGVRAAEAEAAEARARGEAEREELLLRRAEAEEGARVWRGQVGKLVKQLRAEEAAVRAAAEEVARADGARCAAEVAADAARAEARAREAEKAALAAALADLRGRGGGLYEAELDLDSCAPPPPPLVLSGHAASLTPY